MTEGERIAVLYARVSDAEKQDTAQMIRSLQRFAEGRGWPIDSEHEDKVTGDPARRSGDPPGLRAALERVAGLQGKGVLVITDATRLVRSPIELLQLVARVQGLPGAVASMVDGNDLDTTSDFGELAIFMRGWFGRWYLKFVRKQTTRVLRDRQALVREHGGFISSKSKRWRTNLGRPRTSAELVDRMRVAWLESIGAPQAARELGLPESTVRTYYKRFNCELPPAKNGSQNATGKTAETREVQDEKG